jgi:hypothetical protein
MGDKCASKHEIQQLSKTCSVESDGAAGKFSVLPREASSEAQVLEEESAEVVVGSGNEREAIPRTQLAEGPKEREEKRMERLYRISSSSPVEALASPSVEHVKQARRNNESRNVARSRENRKGRTDSMRKAYPIKQVKTDTFQSPYARKPHVRWCGRGDG